MATRTKNKKRSAGAGSAKTDGLKREENSIWKAIRAKEASDDQLVFAKAGAKIGDILQIRLPQDYTVKTTDSINHPPHYTDHPSKVECITITEWMNFNLGNAVKYIWRFASHPDPVNTKAGTLDDLRKAKWYLEREIKRIEGLSPKVS
jgi:hypothetical protein